LGSSSLELDEGGTGDNDVTPEWVEVADGTSWVTTLPVLSVTSGAATPRTNGAIVSVTLRPNTFLLMV